jgi:uncharacterized protein (TIGR02600 family)
MRTGHLSLPPSRNCRTFRGAALVVVLVMLLLLTVLVVGFFRRASVERASSSAYFENNRNSLFADQAVNIVQTQIDHASTRPATAWASQPGMVRTFRQDGSLDHAYKLYSDKDMVTETFSLQDATDALQDWKSSPALFVDLNAPVNGVYPIVNPSAEEVIEGFEITNAPSPTAEQPAPLPVRWLYVLEDGSVIAPSGGSGSTAEFTGGDAPDSSNPIVGRIAFWTDDETCKLNINTASHGAFWDLPRAFSQEEYERMARFQPAAREFQRYPGHPASTSLEPVFGHLFGGPANLDEAAFADFVLQLTPRVQEGGSRRGTQSPTAAVTLDNHRLYNAVDELLFDPAREPRLVTTGQTLSAEEVERSRFFLTARSNAPEVNLFNLPRMAIWPINSGTKAPSVIDRLVAFCSTIGGKPYYFQRENPYSATADMTAFGGRNTELYNYINRLLAAPPPSFGSMSLVDKYTAPEVRQIVTEIFDYIRSSNLYSTAFGATPYTDGTGLSYLPRTDVPANPYPPRESGSGVGQVVPLKIGDTKGFGRIPMISRAVFQLFVSGARMPVVDSGGDPIADSDGPKENEFIPGRQGVTETGAYKTPKLTDEPPENSATLYARWKRFLDGRSPYTGDGEYHGETAQLLTSGIVYFDTFDPMYGYSTPRYNFDIRVSFSGPWTLNSQPLDFPASSTLHVRRDHARAYNARGDNMSNIWHGRQLGGPLLPQWVMQNYSSLRGNPPDTQDRMWNNALQYPLVSERLAIHPPITLINSGSGVANADREFPNYSEVQAAMGNVTFSGGSMTVEVMVNGEVVQTYAFEFPGFTKPVPGYGVPELSLTTIPLRKQMPVSFDFRHRWQAEPRLHRLLDDTEPYQYPDLRLVQGRDVAVSLVPKLGDKRLLAAKSSLSMNDFQPHEFYAGSSRAAVDFRDDPVNTTLSRNRGTVASSRLLDVPYGRNALPDIPSHLAPGVQQALNLAFPPDFDNGTYHIPDDAYVNRADEGSAKDAVSAGSTDIRETAWYSDNANTSEETFKAIRDNESFYSPNRQLPSAAMFGSLPTGVVRNRPWQTLLFRPDPGSHPGMSNPPDYTLLDLFWMPVVEPYAISEPFSTNGKVNMNYQIVPFGGYLTRSTAMRGVLKSEEMLVLENSHARNAGHSPSYDEYKRAANSASATHLSTIRFRKKIDAAETLKGFQEVFAGDRIFRSETEICSLPLIPEGAAYSANFETTYWNSRRLTGDNSRERPYADLLPRLTTRSNTFTVHFIVQSLKKTPGTSADTWVENKDRVTAEFRGSRTIERYIDPNISPSDPIPDYASSANPLQEKTLDQFYRWRVIRHQEFNP